MASKQVAANTIPVTIFSEEKPMVGIPSSVVIDNQGDAPNTITLTDTITTDTSYSAAGVRHAGAVQTPITRIQETVGAHETKPIDGARLKDIKFLGEAKAAGSVTETKCVIIIAYAMA